jgi:hypothetical protein
MDSIRDLIVRDKEAIYIGNVFTIEADLVLPSKGASGCDITWSSSHPRILSESGQVHRPKTGVGDRAVTLTATISHSGQSDTRVFELTVLQLKTQFAITEIVAPHIQVPQGELPHLPTVVVVRDERGVYLTAPVVWE